MKNSETVMNPMAILVMIMVLLTGVMEAGGFAFVLYECSEITETVSRLSLGYVCVLGMLGGVYVSYAGATALIDYLQSGRVPVG